MTHQQLHLQHLIQQQSELTTQINALNANASSSRDLLLKVQGAIEYLQQTGVTLPEPEISEFSDTEIEEEQNEEVSE